MRLNSSSGGVFTILARIFLHRRRSTAWVEHDGNFPSAMCAWTPAGAQLLNGAIPSGGPGHAYRDIKKDLKEENGPVFRRPARRRP
ncbi:MAG: hypothetical protein ACLT8E_02810 [Akkermansia sp.]